MDAIYEIRLPFPIRILPLLLIIIAVILSNDSHAQPGGEPIVIGNKIQIHSRVLNETRTLLISKPEEYDQEGERYPVLYLLDGDENFIHTAGMVRLSG